MLKRKIDKKLENWLKNSKHALLITGARQIGKTYSINHFINQNFEYSVRINFVDRQDLVDLFVDIQTPDQLILLLSTIDGANMHPQQTVIFLDEIQVVYKRREELKKSGHLKTSSLDIITTMKALSIQGDYRFILSGSLLGVSLNDVVLNPAGYMDTLQMYPLDFEEYLWTKGVSEEVMKHIRNCFDNLQPVDERVNKLMLEYFREYVLIGGLPEAVQSFVTKKNLYLVQEIQEQINHAYKVDITTYINDEQKKLRVREIYDSIPSELNSKNKRFISAHVLDKNYLKKNNIVDEYLWLTNAAIALPVYNVTKAEVPLVLTSERKTLKLFLNDIGLLDAMLVTSNIRQKLLKNELEINYGAPYENAVAQELYAHGFNGKVFYYNSKKQGEVDFLIEYNNDVLPIEVKSGKPSNLNTYNHAALNNLIELYNINTAFVLGECNIVKESEHIVQLPIYMISLIQQ